MNLTRAIRLQNHAITVLSDIYSAASICGSPSSDMEERRREALERLGINKAPRWVQSYLDGWWRCRIDQAYRHDLMYGAFVDGVFYSTHRDRPDYYEKHGIEPSAYATHTTDANKTVGHYWQTTREPRPFFL